MTASVLVDRLVEPAYFTAPDYHKTLGPEVGELAELAGLPPDPEQQLVLDAIFGMDKRGKFSAFEVAIICCRQNMKTGLLKQAAIGKVFLLERPLFVWSAHEFSTSQEAFRDLRVMIESTPTLDRMVSRIHMASGAEAIELKGGQRIKFKARTKAGGRGLTGDDVALDEGFALKPEHMGALLPTLSTRPDPQVFYASSAGLWHSDVLRGIRDRGRAGSPRLAYAEWCEKGSCDDGWCLHEVGAPGCRLDDEAAWQVANPAMGRRITADYIRAERAALPPEEFARERLGWWDDPASLEAAVQLDRWHRLAVEPQSIAPAAIAVAVDFERAWASIGAASAEGRHLGSVRRERIGAWVVEETSRIVDAYDVPVVVDVKGPAASLIPDLEAAGIAVLRASLEDYVQACADMFDAIHLGEVEHGGYDELNAAVAAAGWRKVGDRRVWARSRGDISMLEAVTLARWAAVSNNYDPLDSIG